MQESFKSDCVLECMLSRFAFSMSCVHIVSSIFKGGIDDMSLVDMNDFRVFHQSLLLILWLDLSKYEFCDDHFIAYVGFETL